MTCSGHGVCIDGERCQCEAAWDGAPLGLPADCSQLACPSEDVAQTDGTTTKYYCSGVGMCINLPVQALNATVQACDENGNSPLVPDQYLEDGIMMANGEVKFFQSHDYVAHYVECAARTMTIAKCDCPDPRTQVPPDCRPIILAEAEIRVLDSAARRAHPSSWGVLASLVAAMAVAAAVQTRDR